MERAIKILLWILGMVIVLMIFFYPKTAGYGYGGFVPENSSISRMEYYCLGIKYQTYGDRFQTMQCMDCGPSYWCAGIPYDRQCYEWVTGTPKETERRMTCDDRN